jgi:hypothetical protein
MFYRLNRGVAYSSFFYGYTLSVILFCAFEPYIVRTLSEFEERAGADSPSPFHIIVRPIVYVLGLLLFLTFDEGNAQFIYSQF